MIYSVALQECCNITGSYDVIIRLNLLSRLNQNKFMKFYQYIQKKKSSPSLTIHLCSCNLICDIFIVVITFQVFNLKVIFLFQIILTLRVTFISEIVNFHNSIILLPLDVSPKIHCDVSRQTTALTNQRPENIDSSHQLSLHKFFDPSTSSMRKVDNREKRKEKKKRENNDVYSGH